MDKLDRDITLHLDTSPKVFHIQVNLCNKTLAERYAYLMEYTYYYYEQVIQNAIDTNKITKYSQVYETYQNILGSFMEQKDNLHKYNVEKVVSDLEKSIKICDQQSSECDIILGKRNLTLEKKKSTTYEQILYLDLKGTIRDLQGYLYDIQTDCVRELVDYKRAMFPDHKINKQVENKKTISQFAKVIHDDEQ